MHTFTSIPPSDYALDIFKAIGKDWMLITAEKKGKLNTMTASWGGLGFIWNVPAAFVFIRKSRYTKEFVDYSNTFSICMFDDLDKNILQYLGDISGREEDKIKNAKLTAAYHNDGTPYFDEAATVLVCRKMSQFPIDPEAFLDDTIDTMFYRDGDYHMMYIAHVTDILRRDARGISAVDFEWS